MTCSGVNDCWALGFTSTSTNTFTLVEHWDGTAWSIFSAPSVNGALNSDLQAVSCINSGNCWAVGYWYKATFPGQQLTLIEHYAPPVPLLKITSITRLTNGHIVIDGVSDPLLSIQLQAAPDLNSFTTLGSTMTDATGAFSFEDAQATTMSQRFYRALLP